MGGDMPPSSCRETPSVFRALLPSSPPHAKVFPLNGFVGHLQGTNAPEEDCLAKAQPIRNTKKSGRCTRALRSKLTNSR